MTTLVTGATGFVGSAVTRRLIEAGYDVRVLVREHSDRTNLEGLCVEVAVGDLRDPTSLRRALKGCRSLFHVAADYRLWVRRPDDLYEANVRGSINLLQAAADAGVERIVYTSSVATLGLNADGSPSNEDTVVDSSKMIGHYKHSKYLAEQEIRALARREHLPVVTVNPSTPIGPRDIKPTPTGRVIVRAAAGKMPAYVDTGLNLVHVDDVADGHFRAFEHGEVGERYILGGEDWSLKKLLFAVAELTHRRAPRVRLPQNTVLPIAYAAEAWARLTRSDHEPMVCVDGVRMSRQRMYFSSDKAVRDLGYRARPPVEAIRDAIDWFKQHGYV